MPLKTPTLAEALALRHGSGATSDYDAALAVSERIKTRFKRASDFAKLTHGEQLFHEVFFGFDGDVENGGLHQYLTNSTGDDAERVRGHLAELGATAMLAVLDRLGALFPDHVIPRARAQRVQVLDVAEAELDEFEELFKTADADHADAAPEMYARLMDYVEAHPKDFALP